MKGTGEDEVVVDGQLVQPFCEITLVDQTTGFIYYDQGVNDPAV